MLYQPSLKGGTRGTSIHGANEKGEEHVLENMEANLEILFGVSKLVQTYYRVHFCCVREDAVDICRSTS